ncbi:MAG: glycosyltransferase family 2 protein [Patescibacteria group bacterium]
MASIQMFTKTVSLFVFFLLVHSLINPIFFVQASVGIALFVLFITSPARGFKPQDKRNMGYPPISIIVPMRNEEKNVALCLSSLASLDYQNYEIIVANDSSTDGTRQAILEMQKKYENKVPITLIDVPPLSDGWTGKTWALHNAVKKAKYDIWLIADADIRHTPQSLRHSVTHFLASQADIMPRTPWPITYIPGEWPMIFSMFALRYSSWFSSVFLKRKQSLPPEQYVVMSRTFYEDSGGYSAVKNFVPEIIALVKIAYQMGEKVVLMDDDLKEITVRMHEGTRATTEGIVRATDFRVMGFYPFLGISLVIAWAMSGLSGILVGVVTNNTTMFTQGLLNYALLSSVFSWYLYRSRHSPIIGAFAPFLVAHVLYLAGLAIFRKAFKKQPVWKGRVVNVT